MIYLLLFYEYFKTGLFAVGGGMATLPFLYDMSARHPDWFTTSQIADMLAVSESTPGPIGVNMATYVGFQVGGVLGAVIATIGLITPSIIVILIIAAFLRSFRDSRSVREGFWRFAKIPPGYFMYFSAFQRVSVHSYDTSAVWHGSCLVISQSIQTCH